MSTQTQQSSVRILSSILRSDNEARPVLLLGAGASFSSGVPMAAPSVMRLAKRVYAERELGGNVLPEQVKLAEWQSWLQSHAWFIKGEERLAENFPLVVEHLLNPREYRTRLLLDLLQPSNGIGQGYKRLAEFVMRGLIRTVMTVNFDTCLPTALNNLRPHIRHVAEVNRGPGDLREFGLFNRAQIVWLHGRAEQYTDRNEQGEVEKLDPRLVKQLAPLIESSPLIVMGYRGAEPSVMEHLLGRTAKGAQRFKNGIYWCIRDGETPHPNVAALQRAVGRNFQLLEIDGFDEVMADLTIELEGEDAYPSSRSPEASSVSVAFDDQPATDATFDDLDHPVMLATMREYCAKLGRAPVTSETLRSLLIEQGLIVGHNGVETPTSGCVLLFGKDPQRFFRHAIVGATIGGKKRQIFSGNLIDQRRQLIEWFEASDINPTLRVKGRNRHQDMPAYSHRALVELVVNLLVHRDYEVAKPAGIDVRPGSTITFQNPGGLIEPLGRRLNLQSDGRFSPEPNATALRNRALCDIFLTQELGGEAIFSLADGGRSFRVTLAQASASAGTTTIARDDRPVGTYVINVLPFAALPDRVSIIRLLAPLRTRSRDVAIGEAGTFIHRGETELWSFVPLPIITAALGPLVADVDTRAVSRVELEADADQRRVMSWLIRKHFERHLRSLEAQGLILEDGKRRRAYFEGRDGSPRRLVYDTPRRRGVAREVVKQRADGSRAWFENEGFSYEITQVAGEWAVRIKPFYMFTGRDARKPLPAFTRTARATRRMKLDRNKNVDDDLAFWARFLASGRTTIDIGDEHVDDLLLEGSFLTVDIPETGLLAGDEDQDRMSA
ncbi:hypothetical protein [Novosphingobium sp. 9U]|uniref:hypothetical protein n=1 Tax=Novosphingobium sp. 9U TaxID=2653158 RepID=UPI0012F151ED|nr:hypothetical protein [Novosphingobium sp. 9U]VWX50857.1 conserved hypothetical protein [Novosphingobium sp. 9U]